VEGHTPYASELISTMSNFDFYTSDTADFTPDFSNDHTLPDIFDNPSEVEIKAWLSAIPTFGEEIMKDSSPPSAIIPDKEEVVEDICPTLQYWPIREVIDWGETKHNHQVFACQSLGLHEGLSHSAEERWEDYAHYDSWEIVKLILYSKFFNGEDSLNDWQKNFVLAYSASHGIELCFFCGLPSGYW
jgi:hypothetical protein